MENKLKLKAKTYVITAFFFALSSTAFSSLNNNDFPKNLPEKQLEPNNLKDFEYPFENKNMFFGLTLLKGAKEYILAQELDISWVSLQPHVLWFDIEEEPGKYNWSELDKEIKELQALHLDVTMVVSPIINAFGEKREQVKERILEIQEERNYDSFAAAFIAFLRDYKGATEYDLFPNNETMPLLINFIKAAATRYDGDGKDDMPGLEYAVRNWHIIEEFPTPEMDVKLYVKILKKTSKAIKKIDKEAKVIIPGLAGNYSRIFAFVDGFIDDEDGGVWKSIKYTREKLADRPFIKKEKKIMNIFCARARNILILSIFIFMRKKKHSWKES